MDAGYEVPLDVKMWYPNITFTQCWTYYYINAILIHFMPAVLLDLFLKLFGHKPLYVLTLLEQYTTIYKTKGESLTILNYDSLLIYLLFLHY